MTTTYDIRHQPVERGEFPMPNMVIGDFIVVASTWYLEDGPDGDEALVLLLGPAAPFFTVGYWRMNLMELHHIGTHHNIVPAVREYENSGGDY